MKINRRFFIITIFSLFLTSFGALYKTFDEEQISKKEHFKKILKYLNYDNNFKYNENKTNKVLINENSININGWIFTEREVLGIF